jgi:hypothetical protein
MEELMAGDRDRFAAAVKQTGASLSRTEPVFALATQFEGEVDLALAAAEAGLRPDDFRELLARTPALGQALGLLLVGGTVKRDAFVDVFPEIASARRVELVSVAASVVARTASTSRPASPPFVPQNLPQGSQGQSPQGIAQRARPGAPGGRPSALPEGLAAVPESFFGGNQGRFADVGPPGSLLVGVRVSYKLWLGGPKIHSVVPLYRSGGKLVEGQLYGGVNGPETTAVARPGYAVGALRTHTGLGVDGFALLFMRVKGDRLDPSDAYASPWLGDVNGGSPRDVLNDGRPVVGLQGRSGENVKALGLIVVK